MIPHPVADVVGELLDRVADDPTHLPIAEIARVRASGRDVEIDRTRATPIVYVTPRPDLRADVLSPREREVAVLAVGGYSNQQVAAALFISLATVKDHMHSILRKTGLASRSQLIAAWYGGLEPAPDHGSPVDQRGSAIETDGSPANSGSAAAM